MDTRSLLYAVAVSDALGAPFENVSRLRQRRLVLPTDSFLRSDGRRPRVAILGGRADYGTFTDDTQLMLMAVDALRRSPGDPLSAYRENLVAWESGAFTVQGRRLDVGVQTSRAIARIRRGKTADPTDRSGNACLLIGAAVHAERGMDEGLIEAFVRTTHNGDGAVSSTLEFLRLVERIETGSRDVDDLTIGGTEIGVLDFSAIPPTGYSVHTAICALAAFRLGAPIEQSVQVINDAGGDTDSIAAAYAVLATAAGDTPGVGLLDTMLGAEVIEAALAPPDRTATH